MANLSPDAILGFEFPPRGSQYSYSPRPQWTDHYLNDQAQSGSHHEHQGAAGVDGGRRSTTPLPTTQPLFDQTLRPHHAFSLPLQPDGHDFHRHAAIGTSLQDYPTAIQDHCTTFDQAILHTGTLSAHLHPSTAAFATPMSQQAETYPPHPQTALDTTQSEWPLSDHPHTQLPFALDTTVTQQFPLPTFSMTYQTSPSDLLPASDTPYDASFASPYLPLNSTHMDNLTFEWVDISNDLSPFAATDPLHRQQLPNSPTDSALEVRSLSSSDNGWNTIDRPQWENHPYREPQVGNIFNPRETLHPRTFSESSYSDLEQRTDGLWVGHVDIPPHPIGSPNSDSTGDAYSGGSQPGTQYQSPAIKQESQHSSPELSRATVKPIQIHKASSPQRSPINKSPTSTGRSSPPGRRQPRKSAAKTAKTPIRNKPQVVRAEPEKKIGRRKGPLKPDQRKAACEIRKMGACLRCKYLKKTCDTGEPCEGCQPHHTRLWNVPCTRLDIRDLGYFMRDWKTHFEQNICLGFSISNIKGHGSNERTLWITHGYGGHLLPVRARDVLVREENCFGLKWVEQCGDVTYEHEVETASLSTGMEGISTSALSAYLDLHIEVGFRNFVDEYFEGTPYITEMLKTAHTFYSREKVPIVRKALKMLLAYNLTHHITMVEVIPEEEQFTGRIKNGTSRFLGKTAAPVMINFEVKCAMASMWRDLQKEVLEDLSPLYASIYSKEKFKNWPVIFLVITILLAVWEEIQFDYHYRIPDREVVNNFCSEMENIPIKVLVGLFSTISQKLPSFYEWNTAEHHAILNSNEAVCDAMSEVRQHVRRHDEYLRSRCETAFDPDDFDSLSNKFTSKLVLRPTP